jgi:hypothetical protein
VSKITVELEISDELARAVAIKNGGRGCAANYEVQEWAKEALEVAADELINSIRQEQEEESA